MPRPTYNADRLELAHLLDTIRSAVYRAERSLRELKRAEVILRTWYGFCNNRLTAEISGEKLEATGGDSPGDRDGDDELPF